MYSCFYRFKTVNWVILVFIFLCVNLTFRDFSISLKITNLKIIFFLCTMCNVTAILLGLQCHRLWQLLSCEMIILMLSNPLLLRTVMHIIPTVLTINRLFFSPPANPSKLAQEIVPTLTNARSAQEMLVQCKI